MKSRLALIAAVGLLGLLLWPAAEALARAGGGSSGSSSKSGYTRINTSSGSTYRKNHRATPSSDDSAVIRTAMMASAGVIVVFGLPIAFGALARRRRHDQRVAQTALVQAQAAEHDAGWRPEAMRARVGQVFSEVQRAWTEREVELAQGAMSPRLQAQHRAQLDAMRQEGRRNVLDEVSLVDCEVVHVVDRKGTRDDEFWAVVTGRMIDYEVADYDRLIAQRDAGGPEAQAAAWALQQAAEGHTPMQFQELWKFTRDDHGWVLDKIEQDLSVAYGAQRSFSEDVAS